MSSSPRIAVIAAHQAPPFAARRLNAGVRRAIPLTEERVEGLASAALGAPYARAHMGGMKLFTIGYEGATQADVIGRLKAAGVQTLVDVRAVAASRRAGFSKTILGESLKAEGVDYLHLRALGTPKAGRDAARKGHVDEMRAIFADHMAEPASQLQLQQLKTLAAEKRVAMLCFEADHAGCHRAVLAEQLAREDGFEVVNL